MTVRLEPGTAAPDFTLLNQDESDVSLHDLRGQGLILFFYPQAMTPGCTTEACDFRDSVEPLRAAGYVVLGISRDAPAKLREGADLLRQLSLARPGAANIDFVREGVHLPREQPVHPPTDHNVET